MSLQAVASRYAKSLLDLSLEKNVLDGTMSDMAQMEAALESKDLVTLLKSPIVKTEKKLSIYKEVFSGKMGELSNSFFELVIKKGREAAIPEMITEFKDQVNQHKGVSSITVVSATPLSDDALAQIKTSLSASSETLSTIDVVTEVDPALIGGFKLKIADKLYDASVAHRLEQMRKTIVEQ
jgi:F-type H+-transporting ATPase subunit delta